MIQVSRFKASEFHPEVQYADDTVCSILSEYLSGEAPGSPVGADMRRRAEMVHHQALYKQLNCLAKFLVTAEAQLWGKNKNSWKYFKSL